jgi:hypothetical protein
MIQRLLVVTIIVLLGVEVQANTADFAVTKTASSITAAGSIDSFAFLGTEFWVDNLVANLRADLAGDYNNDLVVDAADYIWWRTTANNPSGYNSWRTNFGAGSSSGGFGFSGVIPEPTTMTLVLLTLLAITFHPPRLHWLLRCEKPRDA